MTSHESLGLPALPPKPTSGMPTSGGIQSIPYGYENVLPISQRYKQNPYSMLSSAGTDTETMTCTSDDESEYSTANKMQQVRLIFPCNQFHEKFREIDFTEKCNKVRLNYQLFVYKKKSFVIEFFFGVFFNNNLVI